MRVFIQDEVYYSPVYYLIKIIGKNKNIDFTFVTKKSQSDLIIDHLDPESPPINIDFFTHLRDHSHYDWSHENIFPSEPLIRTLQGRPDYLATIFYMINCMQEYNQVPDDLDQFGRFRYERSYQKRFNIITENLVQHYIDVFLDNCKISTRPKEKSAIFLSHDIDTLYGSFFQDGLWALKRGRLDIVLKLIILELIRNPDWRNIDQIIKIDSTYDLKSTFFWIVNRGKGSQGIQNADYSIRKEMKLLQFINDGGFTIGLHKSCSSESLDEELQKLPFPTTCNRYHFLKFLLHSDWDNISHSAITFDSSLGFAEHFGFRNSFGMPYQPFDLHNMKPFHFIEVPLMLMDGTFHKYLHIPSHLTADRIIDFIEKNSTDCVLSLLWHNTYFTDFKYRSYLKEYKKILSFFYEQKFDCLTPVQIINKYKIDWND